MGRLMFAKVPPLGFAQVQTFGGVYVVDSVMSVSAMTQSRLQLPADHSTARPCDSLTRRRASGKGPCASRAHQRGRSGYRCHYTSYNQLLDSLTCSYWSYSLFGRHGNARTASPARGASPADPARPAHVLLRPYPRRRRRDPRDRQPPQSRQSRSPQALAPRGPSKSDTPDAAVRPRRRAIAANVPRILRLNGWVDRRQSAATTVAEAHQFGPSYETARPPGAGPHGRRPHRE